MTTSGGQDVTGATGGGELLIAGVGGWGIVTMGDILAKAASRRYGHAVWFPSYATAMRGGDSECCVIFSDEEIPSPLIYYSGTVVVLGARRIKDFEDRVRPAGLMLADTTGLKDEHRVTRKDIRVQYLPVMDTARRQGTIRNANLVMLGVYIGATQALPVQLVAEEVERRFGRRGREDVVEACRQAFNDGIALATEGRGT